MKLKEMLLLFLFVFLIITCSDNPTENEDDSDALFQITVSDNNGDRLSGIRVSVYNRYFTGNYSLSKRTNIDDIEAATSIPFTLKQKCLVNLNIYNLENELHDSLIKNEVLEAGNYTYSFYHENNIGTGVFKCKLTVIEDTLARNIVYQDSIYAAIIGPDAKASKIGNTDQNGHFFTDNKLLFPNLYKLPPLIRTGSGGPEQIGTFTIGNIYVIVLTNEQTNSLQFFEKEILQGKNHFNLIWGSGTPTQLRTIGMSEHASGIITKLQYDPLADIAEEYKLYPNYPNHFN